MPTPFDLHVDDLIDVGNRRAIREGREMAIEAGPTCWTITPAEEPTPDGWWRACTVPPSPLTDEDRMGIAKKIWTAHTFGQRIPKKIIDFFGEPSSRGQSDDVTLFSPDGSAEAAAGEILAELRSAVAAREIAERISPTATPDPPPTDPPADRAPLPRHHPPRTARALALKMDRPGWTPRDVKTPVERQVATLDRETKLQLCGALDYLDRYRTALRWARRIDRNEHRGREYLDAVRKDRRELATLARAMLSDWVYQTFNPFIDPFHVLRALAPWNLPERDWQPPEAVPATPLTPPAVDPAPTSDPPDAPGPPETPQDAIPDPDRHLVDRAAAAAPERKRGRPRKARTSPGQRLLFDEEDSP